MITYTVKRHPGQKVRDVLADVCRYPDHPDAGLVDVAIVQFNTAYLAIRTPEGHVVGAVAGLIHAPGELTYWLEPETVGPAARECPSRILNRLTPAEKAYGPGGNRCAQEWRDACREAIKKRKHRVELADGMIIGFEKPIHFTDGRRYDTFAVIKERGGRGRPVTRFIPAIETAWSWEVLPHRYLITKAGLRHFDILGHVGPKPPPQPAPAPTPEQAAAPPTKPRAAKPPSTQQTLF